MAALALALGSPAARAQSNPLIEQLHGAPDTRARVRAAQAVVRLRPPGARPALETALDDRAHAVRRAAARALEAMGDPAAVLALDRHVFDPDRHVRDAVMHALQGLVRRMPATLSSAWGPPAGVPAGAAPTVVAPPVVAPPGPVDWRRVRVLMSLGPLANSATTDPAHVQQLRDALLAAVPGDERYALHPGALPSSAVSRVRHGELQLYSVQGGLTSLREEHPGRSVSVRAEVSLVLVTEPTHAIAATLSGAATAQETLAALPGLPDPRPRLRQRAIESAAQGAMRSLEAQLLPPAR